MKEKSLVDACIWKLIKIGEYSNEYTTICNHSYYDDQTQIEVSNMSHCLFCGKQIKIEEGY